MHNCTYINCACYHQIQYVSWNCTLLEIYIYNHNAQNYLYGERCNQSVFKSNAWSEVNSYQYKDQHLQTDHILVWRKQLDIISEDTNLLEIHLTVAFGKNIEIWIKQPKLNVTDFLNYFVKNCWNVWMKLIKS